MAPKKKISLSLPKKIIKTVTTKVMPPGCGKTLGD